jgi:NAD(P)H-dependent FMN reductase
MADSALRPTSQILVFYGSYRSDRMGIRLAEFLVERLRRRGDAVELIDAKAVNLPMLDRMYIRREKRPSSFSSWPARFAVQMVSYS